RPPPGRRPHRRRRGRARAAAGDRLPRRAGAGPHRLAPRQPPSRHRDRRARRLHPRRPCHRRHGPPPRRRGAPRGAPVQSRGRRLQPGRCGAWPQPRPPSSRSWPRSRPQPLEPMPADQSRPCEKRQEVSDPLGLTPRLDNGGTLARLMIWLSPAYPVGGFSYSHGLEWTVEAGKVRDAATLAGWIEDLLHHGAGRSDAILLAGAWRAATAGDEPLLAEIAELAAALVPSAERRLETLAQGAAFLEATR